ncbi:KR domain-containing protein [Streptomyces yunnanensis]|uniref:KR domain-containing protein n=1 Tax=Streptomyces yunnanensis TaxID=156453 RepID=A0ABY8A3X5_9ACTN|nr:type I polyketide synthase [Streptomyces yunnanensis]WEB39583.1 KR domain-containing protein [Streptomyces yunnanensis]
MTRTDAVDRRLANDPIAIVGVAGMFPKARDVQEFWDNIVASRDCSEEVPEAWWSTDDHYDPDPFAEDRTYCRRGAFLAPVVFDPREFGMPPNSVDSVGLVQLLSLMVAKDVLADAARGRRDWLDPEHAGVVLGVCGTNSTLIPLASRLLAPEMVRTMVAFGIPEEQARRVMRTRLAGLPPWTEDSFPGVLGNIVSGRIANRLNLRAANHTVDAACASSLAALRSAVDELLCRRADLMLTGGCDADNSIVPYMCFSKTPALSLSGRVRPFDAEADGTLVGEGVGMLALKRLDDAERDEDRVYAVLRGLGSSSDGMAQSIYAPCGEGQLVALRRAYEDADCPPRSVGLIEAHGTGTPAGDGVELNALSELLGAPGEHRFVAVGSVKSQIGHTKAAAGIAGMIKAVLALHHKVLPPTINVDTPSPAATGENSPLYLNTTTRPWVRDASREVRRAGVSAFGFGGVNYHAVLEEHRGGAGAPEHALHRTPRAWLWHAADPDELRRRLEREEAPDDGPVPAGHARVGFVATSTEHRDALVATAIQQLRVSSDHDSWSHTRGIHYRRRALPPETKVGALFTGQGSQYVEMGLHAALAVPPVRAAFDIANVLFPSSDSLARAVFPPPGDPEGRACEDRLRRTAYAQSAIGALSMGQYRYLRELGFVPHGLLGHSFGELTALWAAGVWDDETFTALARARGQAMTPPPGREDAVGTLAAVRAPEPELRQALSMHTELTVCNRNAPNEHVVGGPAPAVERFVRECVTRGVPAQRLPVAAAFHTSHVQHAVEAFGAACAATAFAPPALRVYANTAGAAYGQDPEANRRTLVEQLCRPVDFAARLEEMYADGIRIFVEFGPRHTLTGLVERTLGERGVTAISCDIGGAADSCAALKQAAVRLSVLGLPLSGIDRYDVPPRAERPTPSKVARTLEGPLFATVSRRPAYERLLAEEGSRSAVELRRALSPEPESPAPAVAADPAAREWQPDPLSRAAAEHLAAHTRYLDGQLHTAEQLTRLLSRSAADGPMDASLAAAVRAVTEHSLALGNAHTRAGEVVASLLRLPAVGPASLPGTYPHGDARPELPGPLTADDASPSPAAPPAGEPPADVGDSQGSDKSALAQLWAVERGDAEDERLPMDIDGLDPEELERVFREIVAEKTGYDIDMIEPDMDIQLDLGIDSLKQVEIGAEMWRRYPVISRTELYQFSEARTVRELTEKLHEVLASSRPQLQLSFGDGELGRAFVALRELPEPDVCPHAYPDQPHALLLDDGGDLSATLDAALSSRGWRTSRLRVPCAAPATAEEQTRTWGLGDWEEATLSGGLAEVLADAPRLDLCVLPISPSAALPAAQVVEQLRHAVLVAKHVCPALRAAAAGGRRAGLVTVTQLDGALGYAGTGGAPALALASGLSGLAKTVALEETSLFCRALDFMPGLLAQHVGDAFIAEITDLATDLREVARDGTARRTPFLSDTPFPPEYLRPSLPSPREAEPAAAREAGPTTALTGEDLLLITGGASGITSWCVAALAREHRCGYLLLGRTPLTEEPEWAAGADSAEDLRAALDTRARETGEDPGDPAIHTRLDEHAEQLLYQRRIRTALDELRAQGVEAEYVAADVLDAQALAQALAPYAPRVTGVIHGAGVLGDKPLAEMTAESLTPVVDTKLRGIHHVLDALHIDRLRHLVLFSSVSGLWGNLRQADYALASEALTRFGCAFQTAHPRCRVVSFVWGPWTGGMAAPMQRLFKEAGVPVLTREAGCAYFLARMSGRDRDAAGVTVAGPLGPLYRRVDRLPPAGLTAYRVLTGLGQEPVLCDHRIGQVPVLPMTAAAGWALHMVERAHGGSQPVVEFRDFRIARGIFFPEGHPERYRIHLVPDPEAGPDTVRATVHDATTADEQLHYAGVFRRAERPPEAPREQLPRYEITEGLHPGYDDGRLFHGPTLAGLRNGRVDESDRLIVTARMPDPPLGKGAFGGRLYSPALADLLLQAALLDLLRQGGDGLLPLPVSVERVELFSPLPDDEPFVIISAVDSGDNPLFATGTLTACTPDGRIHQRWSGVRALWIEPETAVRGTTARAGSPIYSQVLPGTS